MGIQEQYDALKKDVEKLKDSLGKSFRMILICTVAYTYKSGI